MQPEKMLGKIVGLDIPNSRVTIEIDFFDPDKQEMLEGFLKSKELITFGFWKAFKSNKTYKQLKFYYKLIHIVLQALGIYPNADNVKAFDDEIKRRVFNCEILEIYDKKIPLLPSKSVMSIEDLNKMIKFIIDNYGSVIPEEFIRSYEI